MPGWNKPAKRKSIAPFRTPPRLSSSVHLLPLAFRPRQVQVRIYPVTNVNFYIKRKLQLHCAFVRVWGPEEADAYTSGPFLDYQRVTYYLYPGQTFITNY